MLKKYLLTLLVSIALIAVAVAFVKVSFFSNVVQKESVIFIKTSRIDVDGYNRIVKETIKPLIKCHYAFDLYAKRLNLQSTIKAGRYTLREGMTTIDIVRMLKLGEQTPMVLTFNNIRTPEQLAGRVAAQIEADSLQILNILTSSQIHKKYNVSSKEALMSYFIPNSYEVYWTIKPEELMSRMYRESSKFWNNERLTKAKALNLTPEEVVTLASIVYEETAKVDEMARIAGVYLNRLRIGMPLQADPTVRYAVGDFTLKRILYKHLAEDSPYNTYKHRGLPPTPIAMPSITAIEAVLNYENHNYLYFCARPSFDGYHNFAKTLSQHNVNARAYSKALKSRNIK